MTGSVLVAGTSSGAGKSTLVTGLCRWLARAGVSVAPFKAQNMSLNSFVTRGGEEIGRAQAAQAQAAGIEPEAAMNPVLLKPGTDSRSQVVVMGRPLAEMEASRYRDEKESLLDVVVDAYRGLRARFDVVICEGAGSPAEINLRRADIVNLGFAQAVGAPVIVVSDIDRGGMFASLVGTLALLDDEDQERVRGFVVNRFRGDRALLEPGLGSLESLTGRPTLGVLPFVRDLGVDAEDAPDLSLYRDGGSPVGAPALRVVVVRLPRTSNLTDLDPLVAEPGVIVRLVSHPQEIAGADVVVVPGTRATVEDLAWLRHQRLDAAIEAHVSAGRPVLGICGGYQMLGRSIHDRVESGRGTVDGLGLLPVTTDFGDDKILARPSRMLADGTTVEGYEIHYGVTTRSEGDAFFADEGCRAGSVFGTSWHGLFENDSFRRSFLTCAAGQVGREFEAAPGVRFADIREARFEALADLVADHLDTDAVMRIIEGRSERCRPLHVALS